jgi:glycosyltransferase involved in cell wall biosynthesis
VQSRFLCGLRGHAERYTPYALASRVKRFIANGHKKSDEFRMHSLTPKPPLQGNVLFSYAQAIDAYLSKSGLIPNTHTNYWASLQMVQTFLDLGYCVDVISHRNYQFLPEKDYAIFVDVRRNLERLAPLLGGDCLKIMHLDTAHILFHNAAEARRLLELQQRKGVTLRPRRFEMPNLGIEHADGATTTGNEFTLSTFRYANKPIYRLPVPATVTCPWPHEKDWQACRRWFLFFSSGGLVHKGLDLLLDAFAEMPDYHLIVCGPIDQEEDFRAAYRKELYETPNVQTLGWIDVNGPQFAEVTNRCSAVILPSCSEGASASTVNCMHAGLIPILSYECGLDIDDFGLLLPDCSLESIKGAVQRLASIPTQDLKARARRAWEFARANHTREKFAEAYRNLAPKIIASHRPRSAPRSIGGLRGGLSSGI